MRSLVRNSFFLVTGYAAWSASFSQPARACSLTPHPEHMIDPAEQAVDTTPPGVPVLGAVRIRRQPSLPACNDSGACDGTGLITLTITAPTDDRTPGTSMGYLVEFADGAVPLVFPPQEAVGADEQGEIAIYFNDQDQRLDFTLSVRAMDLAGNLGAPAAVEVRDAGGDGCIDDGRPQPGDGEAGGCSASGQASPIALGMALLALGLVVRRRPLRG